MARRAFGETGPPSKRASPRLRFRPEISPMTDTALPPANMPEHMLTRDTLDATLSSMRRALDQNAAPWRSELSATPYGSDFDFSQPRAKGTVLDQLERTAILLGQLLARAGARS